MANKTLNPINSSAIDVQQKFLDPFPNEIVQDIVFYLTRSDCLRCMQVCRSWYNTVPEYFKVHWSTVKLYRHDVYSQNNIWLRCIDGGKHIKRVVFEWFHKQHEIDRLMRLLFDKNCQNIESLELFRCGLRDNAVLLQLLQHQQLTHLKELKLVHHFVNVPFLALLEACPQLTHFTFTSSPSAYDNNLYNQEPTIITISPTSSPIELSQQSLNINISFPSLTYLNLDAIMEKRVRLEPILRKCPNLRYLLYSNEIQEDHPRYIASYHTNIVHLNNLLLDWCQKLVFLQMNSPPSTALPRNEHHASEWKSEYLKLEDIISSSKPTTPIEKNINETRGELRYLIISEAEGFGPTHVTPHFIRNHNTLEYVYIGCSHQQQFRNNMMVNWSSMFMACHRDKITLPKLRTLILDGLLFENVPLIALLRRCPALEYLTIKSLTLPLNILHIFQHGSKQLKQLHLHMVKLLDPRRIQQQQQSDSRETNTIESSFLEQFVNLNIRGCQIERIQLYEVQNLRNYMLQGIAQLKTIRYLDIRFYRPYGTGTTSTSNIDGSVDSDDEIYQFIEKLSTTKIETLTLSKICSISYKALITLGNLSSLKSLYASKLSLNDRLQVDGPGLVQMMNTTNSLKDVYLGDVHLTNFGDHGKNDNDALEYLNQEMHRYTAVKKASTSRRVKLNNVIIKPTVTY